MDVLVVGAGVAGTVTAIALRRRGIGVLLVDPERPAGAADYDVQVSAPAIAGLSAIGALDHVGLEEIAGLVLRCGDGRPRSFPAMGGAVCTAGRLRRGLIAAALDAGATHVRGRVVRIDRTDDGRHCAVVEPEGGVPEDVTARHVVIAHGVTDRATGAAAVRRYSGVSLRSKAVTMLAAPTTIDPREHPTYIWVLPNADGDQGTCTVGAARLGEFRRADAEEFLDRAWREISAADRALRNGTPSGPTVFGPLNSGFTPDDAVVDGRLRVGDAAGLVNPFTGEGLGYAVESGMTAARCIAANPRDPERAGKDYGRRLAASYVGYFETARHAARRYHLTWRILASTADSDRPFFAKARRAVLFPDGLAGLTAAERMPLPDAEAATLKPFLVACDEVAVSAVRRDWPFLARLVVMTETSSHQRLRPAVPFFAALGAGGRPPDVTWATVGAAIELATLGALAFLGPSAPTGPDGRRAVDWGTTSVILAGDFLLAQAARLIATYAPELSWSFSDWLAELAALRVERVTGPSGAKNVPATELFAVLLEFPARVGGRLGGAGPAVVDALREYGRHCGHALLHTEDVLVLSGRTGRLDSTLAAMLEGRISAVADHLDADEEITADLLHRDTGLRLRAMRTAAAEGEAARLRACAAAETVPDPLAARMLREFVTTLTRTDGGEEPHWSRPAHSRPRA
ncbi:NAD(P)/FAD-dependent oxidoreductase [Spirillospora sp. NPDC048832]